MPNLSVEGFTDSLRSMFVSNLAKAWNVPTANVEIVSFQPGSLVVNAEVVIAEKGAVLSALEKREAEQKLSTVAFHHDFGVVSAVSPSPPPSQLHPASQPHDSQIDNLNPS